MNGTDENGSMCDFKEFDLFADDIVKKLGRTIICLSYCSI